MASRATGLKKRKPKAEKAAPPAVPEAKLTSYQRFEDVVLHRSELKNAPYNPKEVTDEERRRLKKILAKHGMLEPVVWNVRSGNVVSGHLRLSILDTLEKKTDYLVKCARIDVGDKEEKEINIAMNNQAAAGSFNLAKLEPILKEIDLEGAGFETKDVLDLFGVEALIDDAAKLEAMAEDLRGLREREQAMLDKKRDSKANLDMIGYYRVLVFPNAEAGGEWAKASGLDPGEMFYPGMGTRLVRVEAEEDDAAT